MENCTNIFSFTLSRRTTQINKYAKISFILFEISKIYYNFATKSKENITFYKPSIHYGMMKVKEINASNPANGKTDMQTK